MAQKRISTNQILYLAIIAFGLMLVPLILGRIEANQYQQARAAVEAEIMNR